MLKEKKEEKTTYRDKDKVVLCGAEGGAEGDEEDCPDEDDADGVEDGASCRRQLLHHADSCTTSILLKLILGLVTFSFLGMDLPAKLKMAMEHMLPMVHPSSQPPFSVPPLKIMVRPSSMSSRLQIGSVKHVKVCKILLNPVPMEEEER